jgi:NAD(P)-dependent dehydrogenase (short-subunit alcohol dehydrogenase family)
MGLLEGKVAIVTGGTSGIGARTVELFVEEGAKVVIAGRRAEEGEALAKTLGAAASFARTDVSVEADVKAVVAHALEKFGRLDCLFNNAGNPGKLSTIAETDMENFERLMATHMRGVMLGMKHAAAVLQKQRSGSIINTGSVAGHQAGVSAPGYSAVKAAIIHLTRCAAVELGEQGVRVNSISPGAIVTGIFGKGAGMPDTAADKATAGLEERFAALQPIPRAGLPEDIAQAALFLASDAASFINGHDLVVDGGLIAGRSWSATLAQRKAMGEALRSQALKSAAS